ncbi:hypothetical protein [Aquimarina algiphila]|uniref:hypothetical protein n=1 Tax=Aquimarina algiphila TaxID=2047982 RepID=UPI00248FC9F4|nr:hypothetical protein [Aquimarina algiphila]
MKLIHNKIFKTYLLILTITFAACSEIEEFEPSEENMETEVSKLAVQFRPSTYYKAPISPIRVKFSGSSSADLRKLINQNSSTDGNGVIIEIPKKTYTWSRIALKSNVHLEIEGGTTIKMEGTKGFIFGIGSSKKGDRVKNVSISGKGGNKFNVDISSANLSNKNIAVIKIGRVDNFRVGDFNIKDRRSILNSILLSHITGSPEKTPGAKDGVVENITQTGAHTGYGLVQTYNARNILFKDLECTGGVTLRLETDDRGMKAELKNGSKKGGVRNIFAHNIINNEGLTSLMFSPHFVQNGKVTARKIVSNGAGFAIRSENGSIEVFDKNKRFPITDAGRVEFANFITGHLSNLPANASPFDGNPYQRNNGTQWAVKLSVAGLNADRSQYIKDQIGDLRGGTFVNAKVSDVTANYGSNAKLKQKHLKYIPCNDWSRIKNPDTSLGLFNGFEYHGPAVGLSVGGDGTNGNYRVQISGQRFIGFPNGYIKNVGENTGTVCGNDPNTIQKYDAPYPN